MQADRERTTQGNFKREKTRSLTPRLTPDISSQVRARNGGYTVIGRVKGDGLAVRGKRHLSSEVVAYNNLYSVDEIRINKSQEEILTNLTARDSHGFRGKTWKNGKMSRPRFLAIFVKELQGRTQTNV